jgi:hypothetical protein
MERWYSPRLWEKRQSNPEPSLQLPTEEERRAELARICTTGLDFAARHRQLLAEGDPVPPVDTALLDQLLDSLERCREFAAPTGDVDMPRAPTAASFAATDRTLRSLVTTAAVYDRIARAAVLRNAELREVGRVPDPVEVEQVQKLAHLARQVYMALQRLMRPSSRETS